MKQTAVQFVVNELEKLTGLNLKDEPIIEKAIQMGTVTIGKKK